MKSFWIDNSKTIKKLWLYQFAAAFMGIILSFLSTNLSKILTIALSLIPMFFYLSLIYMVMWEAGATEKIRIDGNRAPYKPFNGLLISVVANIPNFLIAVLIIIGYIFGSKSGHFSMEWGGNLYFVSRYAAVLWESMYDGFIAIFPQENPLIFVIIILPALVVCSLGYFLGLKNFRIFGGGAAKNDKTDG